ncbi:hypothetical protein [Alicyclobacillus sendaiensis]|uniref:hypothetical protein n=1 Tax=Alicyclobacillus sendaiensis TaxID=192387 RepID=UPI0026F427DD|nr:hypothetical protein [Alicyclobacillus sendaiensis]
MRQSVQSSLQNRRNTLQNPYGSAPPLLLGKVIASYPEYGTVDVAVEGTNVQGGFYRNVPVMSWSMGSQVGASYFPTINHARPSPTPYGTYDQPIPSGESDVWCVIGHLNGRSQRPVVLGFLHPYQQSTRSSNVGDLVDAHESGVYKYIAKNGTVQIGFPDGSYVLISPSTTPVNMTSVNPNWNPKTTSTANNLTISVRGNVEISVAGSATISANEVTISANQASVDASEVYLGTTSGGSPVARKGDPVQVTVNGTVYTGQIAGGSSVVFGA